MCFLREQDGPVERNLTRQWRPILAERPDVRRAFLVQATYGEDQELHVVLALCTGGISDLEPVKSLRVPFAALFSNDCPLDVAFVNPTQEARLSKVCAPFYEAV